MKNRIKRKKQKQAAQKVEPMIYIQASGTVPAPQGDVDVNNRPTLPVRKP